MPLERDGDRRITPYCPSAEDKWSIVYPENLIRASVNLCSFVAGPKYEDFKPDTSIAFLPAKAVFKTFGERTGLSVVDNKLELISPPFIGFSKGTTNPVFIRWPGSVLASVLEESITNATAAGHTLFSILVRPFENSTPELISHFKSILEP